MGTVWRMIASRSHGSSASALQVNFRILCPEIPVTKSMLSIIPLAAVSLILLTGATTPSNWKLTKTLMTAKTVPLDKLGEMFQSSPTYDATCNYTTTTFNPAPGKASLEEGAASPLLDKWDGFDADDDSTIPSYLIPKVDEPAKGKMQFKFQPGNNGAYSISLISKIDMGNREVPVLTRAEPIELKCLVDDNLDCRALAAPMSVVKVPLETLMSAEEIKAGGYKEAKVNGQLNIVFSNGAADTLLLKFGTDIKAIVPAHDVGLAARVQAVEKKFAGRWICELKKAKN